jgi:hypothetical protein
MIDINKIMAEINKIKYSEMSLEQANKILDRRIRWRNLLLKISWKARLLEKLLDYPILNRFGKSMDSLYEERYTDIPIKEALGIVLIAPISRCIDYEKISKEILRIESLEKK